MISYVESKNIKLIEKESRMMVAGGLGGGKWGDVG